MRTASYPYNNRHRQAPCTHTDKQAVRTIGGEQCLIILVYTSSAKHPNKIGGFVVRGLFSSNMQCVPQREHTSKLNIFSQTIKVSDCFLQYSVFIWQNYTFKMPTLVRMKFILSQTHTALAGSRLYFHPSRSNLFAGASDNGLYRRKALSTTLRLAYPR